MSSKIVKEIKNEITKAVVGKDDIIEQVLAAIFAGGHVLLEDVPGVGKTTLALAFSRALFTVSRMFSIKRHLLSNAILASMPLFSGI